MAGRIILSLCCLLCAGAFFLNGYRCRICSAPVAFWTGSEQKLRETVKDVSGYNQKMEKAFHWYGAAWCVCALAGMLYPIAGIMGIGLLCTAGLFLLFRRYRRVLLECSR